MGDDIVAFLPVGLVDAAELSLALSSGPDGTWVDSDSWMQHTTAGNQQQQQQQANTDNSAGKPSW